METLACSIYVNFLPLFLTLFALYIFQIIIFTWVSKLIPYSLLRLFAAPGVILHELSHMALCILSFHKIVEVSFFNTNGSDAMGFVTHSFNPNNLYQRTGNMFIGIAPAFAGVWMLFYIFNVYELLPSDTDFVSLGFIQYYKYIILKLMSMNFIDAFICIYLTSSIAATMSPSKADYKGSIGAIIITLILFFTVNIFIPSLISDFILDINKALTLFSVYARQSLVIAMLLSIIMFVPILFMRTILKR